jgi:hypothetical protein
MSLSESLQPFEDMYEIDKHFHNRFKHFIKFSSCFPEFETKLDACAAP